MPVLDRNADQFCDLAGFDAEENSPVVFCHDGSDVTLIEVKGARSIVSSEAFQEDMIEKFSVELAQLMKQPGHNIAISYESSFNAAKDIDELLDAHRHNAELKELSIGFAVEETRRVLLRRAVSEKVMVALITRPIAGPTREIMAEKKETAKKRAKLPLIKNAADPYVGLETLDGPHQAFVKSFMTALSQVGIIAEIVPPGEDGARGDLAAVRQGLFFHETPKDWKPMGAGPLKYPTLKTQRNADLSDFFAPPLAKQVISSAPVVAANMRNIAWGSRNYAVAQVLRFPQNLRPFNAIIGQLRQQKMPYRITMHIESLNNGDKSRVVMRQVFAQILGIMNGSTKILGENLKMIASAFKSDEEAVVKANIVAATWVEPGEREELLSRRASALMSGLQSWGDCTVTDSPVDPARALAETVAGMNATSKSWRGTLAPLSDLSVMLPFHRTAPVFDSGESIFTSIDGRLMCHRAFASEQQAWLTLVAASTGSGKSVLANRMNFELCANRPGREMPFLMIADVGVSSSGCMNLLKARLPPDRRNEVMYIRLQNTREHAINPMDIGLGNRRPLERETVFVNNFLLTALPVKMPLFKELIERAVDRVYEIKSDLSIDARPNIWQASVDRALNEECEKAGIKLGERTKYWTLVDEFMMRGNYEMAMRAHRFAMPQVKDIAAVLSEQSIIQDFGHDLVNATKRMLEGFERSYPIFSSHTQLDTGPARVMSIDLQDVVNATISDSVVIKNTLMFFAARQIFMSKIAAHKDEVGGMTFPQDELVRRAYVDYWERQSQTIAETPKRMVMDEYHLTGKIETIAKVVDTDFRTGRKWNLEVMLVSQKIEDFYSLASQATTVMFLNADNKDQRKAVSENLEMPEAVEAAMKAHVNGPSKNIDDGANVLVMYKLRNDERRWVILNNCLSVRMMWALTTKAEDRPVRDLLYERMSTDKALDLLSRRFPDGTAVDLWKEVARRQGRNKDENSSIARLVVEEVLRFEVEQTFKQAAE